MKKIISKLLLFFFLCMCHHLCNAGTTPVGIKVVFDFLNINKKLSYAERIQLLLPAETTFLNKKEHFIKCIDAQIGKLIIPRSNISAGIIQNNFYSGVKRHNLVWEGTQKTAVIIFYLPNTGYTEPYMSMTFDLHEISPGEFKIFLFASTVNGKSFLNFFNIKRDKSSGLYIIGSE